MAFRRKYKRKRTFRRKKTFKKRKRGIPRATARPEVHIRERQPFTPIPDAMPGQAAGSLSTPGKVIVNAFGQFTYELDQTLVKQALSYNATSGAWELTGDREGSSVVRRFIKLKYGVRAKPPANPQAYGTRANAVIRVLLWSRHPAYTNLGISGLPAWDPTDPQYVPTAPAGGYSECTPSQGPKFPGVPTVSGFLDTTGVKIISNKVFTLGMGSVKYKTLSVKTPRGRKVEYQNTIPDIAQYNVPTGPAEVGYRPGRLDPKYQGGGNTPVDKERLFVTFLTDSEIMLDNFMMRLYYTDA